MLKEIDYLSTWWYLWIKIFKDIQTIGNGAVAFHIEECELCLKDGYVCV